jgi:signal transduction histidine kinase/ActR/RegA family two-component response regulator
LRQKLPHGTIVVALLTGVFVSILAAMQLSRANDARVSDRFSSSAESIVGAVENQIQTEFTLLRGTAGFFDSSQTVTVDEFGTYIARLDLERNYPGVLGIGFAVADTERSRLEQLASQLDPNREVEVEAWPEGERSPYSTILFLEPRNEMNLEAIGFDMMSEATRREAMMEAARTGRTTLSGRVQLVQEIDPVKQPGFLVYTPLYRNDGRDHYGWVYSPLRAYDLFEALFPHDDRAEISISIFDGAPSEASLLYRSATPPDDARETIVRTIDVGDREWQIVMVAMPGFASGVNSALPLIIGIVGAVLSILVSLLLWQQARAAERIERQVVLRTSELQATNSRLRNEVAAREKAESAVRQMQRVESIGQLTGGIAHDFNNMLAIVVGNLEIAKQWMNDPKKLERFIDQAMSGADRAASLTQRLLAFSRQQPLSPTRVDANMLIADMSTLIERTIGKLVEVRTEFAENLWPTLVDSAQLENAVLNLAINARDAMEDGNTLTITTGNAIHEIDDGGTLSAPGEFVVIAVSDTGSGMAPDVQAKALDPFFTTKEVGKGTGLGLSQVFGFARQSGGDLTIESTEGEGTTIKIYLPRFQGEKRDAESESPHGPAEGEIPRGIPQEIVLVVDDEEQVLAMTVEQLRELGYTVIHAKDGETALRKLGDNPGVRVVLTDIVMPGMNGNELAERALAAVPDLKIVFVSGFDTISDSSKIAEQHGIVKLQKPFTRQELALAIRATFDTLKGAADDGGPESFPTDEPV